jgi:hypothetical protein
MPQVIAGISYWELEFDSKGRLVGDQGMSGQLPASQIEDLLVFSHGWNNSFSGARDMYREMIELISALLPADRRATTGLAGVLWPSLLFPEDKGATAAPQPAVAVGDTQAADATAPPPPGPMSSGGQLADALAPAFPGLEDRLRRLGELLDTRPEDPDRLEEFRTLVGDLVTTPRQDPEDSGEESLLTRPTRVVLETMAALAPPGVGDAQGGNIFDTLWSGARELLRTLSYYEMKNRAGLIGRTGLSAVLRQVHQAGPGVRVHLLGHSFGARLVSFALAGLPPQLRGAASPVKSLLLIQGAFSHFSFARHLPIDAHRSGALAPDATGVDGPLLATYTEKDRAIGWWYPAASQLNRQDNQAAVDLTYQWGGLGHDGFQHAPATEVTRIRMVAARVPYTLQKGRFYRIDANNVIKNNLAWFSGAHSDILHPEVAWLAVSAAGLS